MSKASTVRLLHAERCSVAEIAAVVGWKLCDVRWFIRTWVTDDD
ncbi:MULTISPECIES: hypothetical protein [Stenotrophomonas]|nr:MULTISPECIES: hypothetical protein [Stenotrophomonas]